MEARAGIRQFRRLNDLARGGTITHSVAFRNIPGPTVPLTPQENAPDGGSRRRNSPGRSGFNVRFTPNNGHNQRKNGHR